MIFTKTALNTIRTDLNAALAVVAAKHGITLDFKNISYSDNSFRTTLHGSSSESAVDNNKSEFERYAARFGINVTAFNETFINRGDTFTIVGIKPRSHKYPILAKQRSNGKTYKMPMSAIPAELKSTWAA